VGHGAAAAGEQCWRDDGFRVDRASRSDGQIGSGHARALTEQIGELAQLQQWSVDAALELQKRADAAIKSLEAERVQWQSARVNLERQAVQAIQNAVKQQSGEIERQTVRAFAAPLRDIQQAAGYVRQNLRDVSWLMIGLMLSAGLVIGLLLGYLPLRSSQNSMQEQLNRIEQYLAAQPQAVTAPAAPTVHAPAHKGKAK